MYIFCVQKICSNVCFHIKIDFLCSNVCFHINIDLLHKKLYIMKIDLSHPATDKVPKFHD